MIKRFAPNVAVRIGVAAVFLLAAAGLNADEQDKKQQRQGQQPAPQHQAQAPPVRQAPAAPAPAPRPQAPPPQARREAPRPEPAPTPRPQPAPPQQVRQQPAPAAPVQRAPENPPRQAQQHVAPSTPAQEQRPQPGPPQQVRQQPVPSTPGAVPHPQAAPPRQGQEAMVPGARQGGSTGLPPRANPEVAKNPSRPEVPRFTPKPNVAVDRGPGGKQIVHAPNGSQVHVVGGHVAEVHTHDGAVVRYAPNGARHVEMTRPDGRVVVAHGPGHGYVEHRVVMGDHQVIQRTYLEHGHAAARIYRPFEYRPGVTLDVYTPVRYYHPGFYAFVGTPWVRPIAYGWGWSATPWFGFYAGYFEPAPFYPGPAFWLTDYLVATTLEQAYGDQVAANLAMQPVPQTGQPILTPEIKQEIADEVARQLRQEQAEAQSGGTASYDPFAPGTPHVFVADTSVQAFSGNMSCAINSGDVMEMQGTPAPDTNAVNVLIRASTGTCPAGAVVAVGVQDLMEMQNGMRQTIHQGLGELQKRQGSGGLPTLSADAAAPSALAGWASQLKPDEGVQTELAAVSNESAGAEQEAINGSLSAAPAAAAPGGAARPAIGLGSTIADVTAAFGEPTKTVDLGSKKIYIYKDCKVTFIDGKVVDVD